MNKPKLLPCPFCGEDEAYLTSNNENSGEDCYVEYYRAYVRCDYCGARGEPTDSHDTAIEAWNRREL